MLRLYLDEDLMEGALVERLRAGGIDLLTTAEAGRAGASDDEQLEFAAAQGRVLCTGNVADFARLQRQWTRQGGRHAGMVLVHRSRMTLSAQGGALLRLAQALSPEDMEGQVEYLRNWVS